MSPEPIRPERMVEVPEERLEALERRIEMTQRGSGGVGCCGGLALVYIIYLLWQIRDAVGAG